MMSSGAGARRFGQRLALSLLVVLAGIFYASASSLGVIVLFAGVALVFSSVYLHAREIWESTLAPTFAPRDEMVTTSSVLDHGL
jgi:hypothetical protein